MALLPAEEWNTSSTTPSEGNNPSNVTLIDTIPVVHLIICMTMNVLGSLVGAIGSFVVLVVLLASRRLRTKTTNALITSLIVSDFLVTTFLQPARANHYNMYFKIPMLDSSFIVVISAICYLSSMGNILMVSAERYFAVVFPFKYMQYSSPRLTYIVIAIIWVSSAAVAVPMHKRKAFDYLAIATFCIVLVSLIVMYTQIFRIIAQQKRREFKQQAVAKEIEICDTTGDCQAEKKRGRTDKSTVTVATLGMTFICLWLPTWVILLIMLCWPGEANLHFAIAQEYLVSIHLMNSSINWYIYCWMTTDFRGEFNKLLKRLKSLFTQQ